MRHRRRCVRCRECVYGVGHVRDARGRRWHRACARAHFNLDPEALLVAGVWDLLRTGLATVAAPIGRPPKRHGPPPPREMQQTINSHLVATGDPQ